MSDLARVAVSSCLVGQAVRYDGGHKRAAWIDELERAPRLELVSVCPEVEAGFGVPRLPIQVERAGSKLRLRVVETGEDVSEPMARFARLQIQAWERHPIDGYLFKARSPSCGLVDASYLIEGIEGQKGPGVWARQVQARWPDLPITDETELADPSARKRFVERVLEHHARRSAVSRS